MRPDTDTAVMTPDERFREVAAIFAAGILRLRARAAIPTETTEHPASVNPPESGEDCLELGPETVLSVHGG